MILFYFTYGQVDKIFYLYRVSFPILLYFAKTCSWILQFSLLFLTKKIDRFQLIFEHKSMKKFSSLAALELLQFINCLTILANSSNRLEATRVLKRPPSIALSPGKHSEVC